MQPGDNPEQETPITPRSEPTQNQTQVPQDNLEPASEWKFTPGDQQTSSPPSHPIYTEPVSWTASEYLSHPKNAGWFISLALVVAVLAGAIYLLTHSIFSPVMVVVIGAAFGLFAGRQPSVLQYSLTDQGIQIGSKFYPYESFKSFSVLEEGAINSLLLMPLKRFMPPISIYYAPNDEEKILEAIGTYLPRENREHDAIDRLMRKVRF